ncbi:MAG: Gldg family protein [Gemmataceae bacterium]
MANETRTPEPPAPPARGLIAVLLRDERKLRIGLLALAGLLAVIPIALLIARGTVVVTQPVWLWGLAVTLVALGVAIAHLTGADADPSAREGRLRLELMLLGGLLGLSTTLLGFALPMTVYAEKLAAGLESWRANPAAVVVPCAALLGGLVLMFASLQLGRGMERQNQNIRRLIYGYNAVLTGLLLLAVLALPNVLAYAEPFTRFFGRPFDWTQSGVNTISDKMRNLLADLREPVKVYVLMPRSPITVDTQTLLDNCRSLTPKVSWEQINPQSAENIDKIRGLMEKYTLTDAAGLLVVYGTEGEKTRADSAFIKVQELYEQDMGGRGRPASGYSYLGENALLNTLVALIEGKMTIYFTTGHGELGFDDAANPMQPPRARQPGSLSKLKGKLSTGRGVEVRPLTLDRSTKKIPDDATVVVVARPTEEFSKAEADVLRAYLERQRATRKSKDKDGVEKEEETVTPGRLIVLLEPMVQKEGGSARLARTGLEELLAENRVQLGNDRVLSARTVNPQEIGCLTPRNSSNPIARAFHASERDRTIFPFQNARTVTPLPDKGPGFAVDVLMQTIPSLWIWAETNMNVDPTSLATSLREDPERAEKVLSTKPLPIAVAVSTSSGGAPRDAAHAAMFKDTPRMVVFGAANWVTDDALAGGLGLQRIDLFNSCVAWLREKSSIGKTIEGKKRKEYELNVLQQDAGRLTYLPLGLMVLGIIGLGTGVWVVRRR